MWEGIRNGEQLKRRVAQRWLGRYRREMSGVSAMLMLVSTSAGADAPIWALFLPKELPSEGHAGVATAALLPAA